ncbi:MAG TPA: DUF4145 domain-containing protein, partial [Isosphaeraceae bacterium]|nr:DUF4145 domain-containing protein [Isosphaeraceae bacterium]
MAPSLQDVLDGLSQLSLQIAELREEVDQAIGLAQSSPRQAVGQARLLLESVLREVYAGHTGTTSSKLQDISLDQMRQLLKRDGVLPPEMVVHVEIIQKLGNLALHYGKVKITHEEVRTAFTSLIRILTWFIKQLAPEESSAAVGPPSGASQGRNPTPAVIGAIGPQGAQGPTAASEPMPSDTPMLDSKEREPAEAIGPASVSRVELADDKERVVPSFAPSPVVLAPGSSASAMNSTPIVPGMTVAQSTPAAEVTGEHPSMASPGSRGSIAAAVSQITPVPPHPAHTGNLTLLRWRNALNTYPKTAWEPPPFLERLKNLFRSYRLLLASIPMVLGTGLLSVLCHYT